MGIGNIHGNINFAGLDLEHTGIVILDDAHLYFIDIGLGRIPVTGVRLEHDQLPFVPLFQTEGATTQRLLGHCFNPHLFGISFGKNVRAPERQVGDKDDVGFIERNFDRQIVYHFNLWIGGELPTDGGIFFHGAIQRELDIFGRDWRVIAELGIVAQFKGEDRGILVDLPRFGQPRFQLSAVRRILDQGGKDLMLRPE